ncbi:all3515 family Zur-repressed PEP-CTERM protein [Botrimarina sp.]|uniref:all3515 family Zur-repressed PEP-CTERM protein n=1 Tax=Botrimarina sp. TaxID=2795802 RepID=UPI0032EBD88F
MKRFASILRPLFLSVLFVGAAAAAPEPGITLYHVGYDNSPLINFGAYTGLENPNYQRLTFLLSHTFPENATSNHFHRIGAYSYTGSPSDPQPGFSANNRVPEPYQMDDGLSLLPGSGVFAGKLISGLGPAAYPGDEIEQEYGDTTIAPIDNLFQYDNAADPDGDFDFHPGHYLLNASGGAYKQSIANATVGLKLVGLTPGLTIHDGSGSVVMDAVNDSVVLGPGADWAFEPVFAVGAATPAGATYEATFVLQDLSPTPAFGDSAEFTFAFVAVPEPSSAAAVLAALAAGLARRRR